MNFERAITAVPDGLANLICRYSERKGDLAVAALAAAATSADT